MKRPPRLLDLFSGAGGAAVGYARAGFEVVGVDHVAQPRYPFEFIQADALSPPVDLEDFDVIHASPPCQAYSAGARMRNGYAKEHPKLIEPVRAILRASGKPYVIENVREAPLLNPTVLCGSSFGLQVRRHRGFESNVLLMSHPCQHYLQEVVVGVYGSHPEASVIRKGHPAIRAKTIEHAQEAMGMPWVQEWHGLKEAIPPAFTEHVGEQLMQALKA